jgi:carboxyl-terminal processing protease
MVTRVLLALCMCIFLNTPSFSAENQGLKDIFDWADSLTCEQAESLARNSKEAGATKDSVDTKYFRRIVETYALLSRCALNQRTRIEFYDGLLEGMVTALGDPHSRYMNEKAYKEYMDQDAGQFVGIGVQVEKQPREGVLSAVKIIGTTSGAPAEKAGLKSGDVITKINDRFVKSYKVLDDAMKDFGGPQGTTLSLLITRDGIPEPFAVAIVRDEIRTEFLKITVLPNKWFVAKINAFQGKRDPVKKTLALCADIESAYKKALKSEPNLKGFVLDLRDNPGGLLNGASCVVDLFATEQLRGKALISIQMRDGFKPFPITIDPHNILKGKPLMVLVNEHSASASEVVAKAVQYYDLGVVVGAKTFGKGSIQLIMSLSDKETAVKYTFAQYLVGPINAPTPVQGVGVTPNIFARKQLSGEESKNAPRSSRESDLDGALETSTVAKDLIVKKTKETNPALYAEIIKLISEAPFNMEVTDEVTP